MADFIFKSEICVTEYDSFPITNLETHRYCDVHLNILPGDWNVYEYTYIVRFWKSGVKESFTGFDTSDQYLGVDCGYITVHNSDALADPNEGVFVGDDEQFNENFDMGGDGSVNLLIHKNKNGQIDGFVLDPEYQLTVIDGKLVQEDGSDITDWWDI